MTRANFEEIHIAENNEPLVDLSVYPFIIEPAYFNQGLSEASSLRLRQVVADKLLQVQDSFSGKFRLKIWDAHRSRGVQNAIYNSYDKKLADNNPEWNDEQLTHATEQFVTKATTQKRVPPHATGGAVDLTLVDHAGQELDMGTDFDFFGPEAAPFYFEYNDSNVSIRENRKLLRDAMLKEGFMPDEDEWWHFDFGNQLWALRAGADQATYGEIE